MGMCVLLFIKYGIFSGYICFLLILLIMNLWIFFNWEIVLVVLFFGGVMNLSNDLEKFVVIELWVSVDFSGLGWGVCVNVLFGFIWRVLCLMLCLIFFSVVRNLGDLSVVMCVLKWDEFIVKMVVCYVNIVFCYGG